MMSSGLPKPCAPLGASKPTTLKLTPRMRMVLPMHEEPLNRFSYTVCPMTHTRAMLSTSRWVMKRPCCTG
jgi:hypothetical protein